MKRLILSVVCVVLVSSFAGCGGGSGGAPAADWQGQYVGRVIGRDILNAPVSGNLSMYVNGSSSASMTVLDTSNNLMAQVTGRIASDRATLRDVTGNLVFEAAFVTDYVADVRIPQSSGAWRNTANGSFGTWSTQKPVLCTVIDPTAPPLTFFGLRAQDPTSQQLTLSQVATTVGFYGCTTVDGVSFGVRVQIALHSDGTVMRDAQGRTMKTVIVKRIASGFICVGTWSGPSLSLSQVVPDLFQ